MAFRSFHLFVRHDLIIYCCTIGTLLITGNHGCTIELFYLHQELHALHIRSNRNERWTRDKQMWAKSSSLRVIRARFQLLLRTSIEWWSRVWLTVMSLHREVVCHSEIHRPVRKSPQFALVGTLQKPHHLVRMLVNDRVLLVPGILITTGMQFPWGRTRVLK